MALKVKCKACGSENPMGDIFCRQCGAEIDINNLTPDQIIQEKEKGKLKKYIERASNIIVLIGLILCVIVLVPMPGAAVPELTKENIQRVEGAVGAINEAMKSRDPKDSKDQKDNKVKVSRIMLDPELAGGVIEKMFFEQGFTQTSSCRTIVKGEGKVKFIMKTLICGFPFRVVVNGRLEDGSLNDYFHWPVAKNTMFTVSSVWIGLVPVGAQGAVFTRSFFMSFLNSASFRNAQSKIDRVCITNEKQMFSLHFPVPGDGGRKK